MDARQCERNWTPRETLDYMETYGWNVSRESTEGMNATRLNEGRKCRKEMYANTTLVLLFVLL